MPERVGIGVLTTDRALVVRTWNPWLAAVTGRDEAAVRGRTLDELAGGPDAVWHRDAFQEILDAGSPRVFAPAFHHYLIRCAPQQPSKHFAAMQQRVTIAPLREDEAIVGLMVTIEDVTERLDEERDLAARLEEGAGGAAAVAAVGSDDWRLRRTAVQTLRRSATAQDIAYLIQALQRDHQDFNVLSSALQVLIAADLDVVPPLVTLLSDPDANVRMHAALALGHLRTAAAARPLMDAVADPDHNVRFHAIEALGRLAAPEAVDLLAETAASGDFFLAFAAVDALANTDDPRVGARLVALLEQEELRAAIVDTLAAIGDEDCVVPLVDLVNHGHADGAAVAAALARIHARYEDTYGAGAHIADLIAATLMPSGIQEIAAALEQRRGPLRPLVIVLGCVSGDAVDALVGALGEPDVQKELHDALLRIGRDTVEPLLARLAAGTRQERLAAAALLGRLGDRRAVPPLITLLRAVDGDLVSAAAAALAMLGDARALDELLPLFAHPLGSVRQAVIAAVNSIGAAATATRLRPRLTDPDPRVRESAIRVAGYFGFDECIAAIMEATADEHEDVRRAAIEQLPVIDDARAPARLLSALASDTPRNRAAAAHALRAADDEVTAGAVERALADDDPWVRYFAAGTLARRRVTAAIPALARCAREDAAPFVRIAALQALGELGAAEVVDIATALTCDPDHDLVAAAISALGGVRDARADAVLYEALRSTSERCRVPAALALSTRSTAAAVEALGWAAHLDEPAGLRRVAIDSLCRIVADGGSAAADAVLTLLDLGVDPAMREDVLTVLATLGASAVPAISRVLSGARRPASRLVAVEGLARMRHRAASDALAAALLDRDATVRSAAIAAFGRLGTPNVAPVVARLAESDPDPGVRRRAASVSHRHGWDARSYRA